MRIQLDFGNEDAVQGDVPVNGRLTPTKGRFATSVARQGRIVTPGADAVSCDVFADEQGRRSLGVLEGDREVVFAGGRDVVVAAIRCVQ